MHDAARPCGDIHQLLSGHDDPHQPSYLPINEPVFLATFAAGTHDQGTIFLSSPVHEVPGVFTLDHVSVGIDGSHSTASVRIL
jgi:hypothetical protein